jgi:hypothetical protein
MVRLLSILVALPALSQVAVENLPLRLEAPFSASSYKWELKGQVLPGATNKVLIVEQPQEADAGGYRVEGNGKAAIFKVQWVRAVRVFINNAEVRGDRVDIRGPSQIRLVSSVGPLPIRFTLDGSEPTSTSYLYKTPIMVTNGCVLRTSIIIPEGDSIKINRSYK